MEQNTQIDIITDFIQSTLQTVNTMGKSIALVNKVEGPFGFQKISDSEYSPVDIAQAFRSKVHDFLAKAQKFDIPKSARIDFMHACDVTKEAVQALDVVAYDWNEVFPKGQDVVSILAVAERVEDVVRMVQSLSDGYDSAGTDLGMVALPNLMFTRSDLLQQAQPA